MSSDDWWNSTPTAEVDAVGGLPSSVDPINESPEETGETLPLQPRTRSSLSPNNPPKPAPGDLTPRTNHLHPSSRSPSPYGRHPTPDPHHFGSNGGYDLSPGHTGPGYESGPRYGHGYESGPGYGHGYGAGGGRPIDPDTPEWSTYHHEHSHKKVDRNAFKRNMTIAKGFLDISLLSANSNQLRNLLNFGDRNESRFYVIMTGLITSISLQLLTGVLLIIMERWNINKPHHQQLSLRLNNVVTVMVFLTLILNCLVSSMGVAVMQHDLAFQQDLITRGARATVNDSNGAELFTSG